MSETTFLTRVTLENYKSIRACDVRLGPLMFLVGPNGAGKIFWEVDRGGALILPGAQPKGCRRQAVCSLRSPRVGVPVAKNLLNRCLEFKHEQT